MWVGGKACWLGGGRLKPAFSEGVRYSMIRSRLTLQRLGRLSG